ncbi:MAG TPA: carotenoid biosynthesis protein [Longimicrobium sp.]|nr:carotenoid biosynthesis protein [Longimicrobium sp.]
MGTEQGGGGAGERASRVALWALYAFTAVAVAGYASFGTHPELLARFPGTAGFYGVAFLFFSRVQIIVAGAALALFLTVHARGRWLGAFALLYGISLCSELAGTTAGLPFGPYAYTPALGPRWFGHVPLLIPLSWFFMAVPSYALARILLPIGHRAWERVLLASFILLSWDLSLDPAMSHATRYWEWGTAGPYYGMPLLNLFGWYVTGLALMGALAALRSDAWVQRLPARWLAGFYAANLLLPVGMILARGLWPAALVTLAALGAAVLLARLRAPRRRASLSTAEAAA